MSDGKSSEGVVDLAPRRDRQTRVSPARERGLVLPERVEESWPATLSLLVGLLAWEVSGRVWTIPFLPPLSLVVHTAVRLTLAGQIAGDLVLSLGNLALGYGLAVCCGIGLGLVTGLYRKAEYAIDPILSAMLASPKLLFLPVLYTIFGVSRNAQIAIIFLSAVFVITANAMSAVRTVDPATVEMALAFGANQRQIFWKVLLPGSLPLTMAGLRLGMGRAVKGMVTGEMYIALFGLGGQLRAYGNRFDAAGALAILLVVVAVALVCTHAVRLVERHLTPGAASAT